MDIPFGTWVRKRREGANLSTLELARRLGKTTGSYVSMLETGKIGLPGAEIRRQLATALGVSHLDVLIAAGELLPEEVSSQGKEGVILDDEIESELIELIRSVNWESDKASYVRSLLTTMKGQ